MDKGMEESILRPTCDARDQSLALGKGGCGQGNAAASDFHHLLIGLGDLVADLHLFARQIDGGDGNPARAKLLRRTTRTIAYLAARTRPAAAAPELLAFAKAHEAWEALLIARADWDTGSGLPMFTEEVYDAFIELQSARNAAVAKATGGRP